ncbi:MAG: hypothetical protein ACR2RV_22910 [Verrucomicrobiales bacterium]
MLGSLFYPASAQESAEAPGAPAPSNPVTIGSGGRIVRESPAEADSGLHLHGLWESRYVSEGRDNLDGGSLLSTFNEFSFGPLTFAPWFAWGPDSDYTELNLSLVAGFNLGDDFELYTAYTHLRSPSDNVHDNEVAAGLIYTGLGWLDLGGDWYHSFDADGSFFELFATREFELSEQLSMNSFALVGFNDGYIPDGHDGGNNVILGLDASWKMTRHLGVNTFASYNWAIDRDAARYPGDESLGDFFWGGVGVRIDF